jgi:hypothetical protein
MASRVTFLSARRAATGIDNCPAARSRRDQFPSGFHGSPKEPIGTPSPTLPASGFMPLTTPGGELPMAAIGSAGWSRTARKLQSGSSINADLVAVQRAVDRAISRSSGMLRIDGECVPPPRLKFGTSTATTRL